MKFFKWKIYLLTSSVCLLAIFPGLALWNSLPEKIAIHFDINNNPDNFASKAFVVFAIPILMVLFQTICCIANDIREKKHDSIKKISLITKWIIPIITNILMMITLIYASGTTVDIRKIAVFIMGIMLIVIGNYIPKLDFVNHFKISSDKARKINRFLGYESVIMGVIFIFSMFLPPIFSVISIILLIPYTISGFIYGIIIAKK